MKLEGYYYIFICTIYCIIIKGFIIEQHLLEGNNSSLEAVVESSNLGNQPVKKEEGKLNIARVLVGMVYL